MITRFDDKYAFDKEYRGTVAQSIRYDGKETQVKVYIHNLMPNIIHGGSGKSILSCPYHNIFVNTPETMPKISDTKITEKNYLLAKVDINSSLEDISEIKTNAKVKVFKVEFDIFADTEYLELAEDGSAYMDTHELSKADRFYNYVQDNTDEGQYDVYNEDFYDASLGEYGTPNNPVTEEKLYHTNNTEGKNFVILTKDCDPDINPEFIYSSANKGFNQRLIIYNEDPKHNDEESTFLYKSNDVEDGMYYEIPYFDKEYIIRQNSDVRCKFLGKKASRLYINTDNT